MAYLSISGRPGNLLRATSNTDGTAYFAVSMRDGILMGLTFDKATAAQWAKVLNEFAAEAPVAERTVHQVNPGAM